MSKSKQIKHDKLLLENILFSFNINDAHNVSSELISDFENYEKINSNIKKFQNKGEDNLMYAIRAYQKALESINNFFT